MRAGLLAAGTAVAIIGVGVLIATLTFSTGPQGTQTDPVTVPSLAGHSFYSPELEGINQSSTDTHFAWASSQSLLVTLYPSVSCLQPKGICSSGRALVSWWATSGSWSASGQLAYPLFLNVTNPNGTPVAFAGTLVETYATSALTNPSWGLFLPLIGGVVLLVIGGVGIFLGLFLPQGVYSQPDSSTGGFGDAEEEFGEERDLGPVADDDEHPPGGPT